MTREKAAAKHIKKRPAQIGGKATKQPRLDIKSYKTPSKRSKKDKIPIKQLRKIRQYQKMIGTILTYTVSRRIVGEELQEKGVRMSKDTLHILIEAVENWLVRILEDANLATRHAGRVTLHVKDIILTTRIKKKNTGDV